MQFIYHNEYYGIEFSYFENKGYSLVEIPQNDYTYINKIKNGDVLFIKLDDIDYINASVNKEYKLTIFLFINHEYCNRHRRKAIIENRNINHRIYFLTTHLDNDTTECDLALRTKCLPFKSLFSEKAFQLKDSRNKKYNFFNRSINLRRIKIFELIKKHNIQLKDCYYTFGLIIKKNTFGDIKSISDFINYRNSPGGGRDGNDDLTFDIEYLNQFTNEFFIYENKIDVELGNIQSSDSIDMYDEVNINSLDSYASFIVESSGDSGDDLRLTEKTIRAWLCKNIFISLQCRGFNRALRNNGIETFEDVFGLDTNWDENISETERIETFVNALKRFNELPIEEVEQIYNTDSVQQRLENNYRIVNGCFNPLNAIMEIDKLIGYENNVY